MAKDITISTNAETDMEAFSLKSAIQSIATNFNKENLIYLAELSRKPNVNEKFIKLKNNPFIKKLI